jgi:hypothetical protein
MPMYEARWWSDKRYHILHISAATLGDAVRIAKFRARDDGAVSMSMYGEATAEYLQCLGTVDLDGEESE